MNVQELLKYPAVVSLGSAFIGGLFPTALTFLNNRYTLKREHAQWQRQQDAERVKWERERLEKKASERQAVLTEAMQNLTEYCCQIQYHGNDVFDENNKANPLWQKTCNSLVKTITVIEPADEKFIKLIQAFSDPSGAPRQILDIQSYLIAKLTGKEWTLRKQDPQPAKK